MAWNATGVFVGALVLMAIAPSAYASRADDTLSRTFVFTGGMSASSGGNGIAWHDASNPRNWCDLDFADVEAPLLFQGLFYYELGRVYTNLPGFGYATEVGPTDFVPLACPGAINALCNPSTQCGIHIKPAKAVMLARTEVPQDGLVCSQASAFVTCTPTSAEWTLALCPWLRASFLGRAAGSSKGVLAGTALENLVFSQDIDCSGYVNMYNASSVLDRRDDRLLTSVPPHIQAALLVPYRNGGDDTGFIVSCLKVTYDEVDSSTPIPTATPDVVEDGVDWSLVLDLDGQGGGGWQGALWTHFGIGSNGQSTAGIYDLGGDNDCDFASGTVLPACSNHLDDDGDGKFDDIDGANELPAQGFKDVGCWRHPTNGIPYYDPTDPNEA